MHFKSSCHEVTASRYDFSETVSVFAIEVGFPGGADRYGLRNLALRHHSDVADYPRRLNCTIMIGFLRFFYYRLYKSVHLSSIIMNIFINCKEPMKIILGYFTCMTLYHISDLIKLSVNSVMN